MAYIGNSPENIQRGRRFVYEFKATAGQTVFSGTDLNNQTLDLLEENEMGVYLNGVRLADSDDYTVSGDTLTLISAASLNDQLTVETQAEIANISSYTRAEADARYINYDGDIVAGDLQISGEVDAGSLIVDTDVLVVDATNNRVGIGTTSPARKLTVLGVNNTTNFEVTDAAGGNTFNIYNNTTSSAVAIGTSSGLMSFGFNGIDKVHFKSNGNVGIGTNSPDTILHISSAGSPQIRIQDTTNDVRGQFTANDSNVVIGTVSNHSLQFATNNGNQVTLAASNLYPTNNNTSQLGLSNRVWNKIWTTDFVANGNVGIGTSSPSRRLHVKESGSFVATFEGGTDAYTYWVNSTGGVGYIGSASGLGSGGITDLAVRSENNLIFLTNAGSERMRISSSGKVGINTTTMQSTFNVQGVDGNIANFSFPAAATELKVVCPTVNVIGLHTGTDDNFIFGTNSTERMRLDATGNLLVGTTNGNPTGNHEPGTLIFAGGQINVHRDGGNPARFGSSVDGNLTEYYKQGAHVGSIGVGGSSAQPTIGSNNTVSGGTAAGLRFDRANNAIEPWNVITNALADSTIDLGYPTIRFKDLYLSGGIQFDSRSNKLDDYEEGTFTLNLHLPPDSLTNAHSTQNNRYVKIGSQVWIQGKILLSAGSSSSSTLRCSGLPFTTSSGTASTGSMISRYGASFDFVPYVFSNSAEVHFYQISTTGNWNQVQYSELAGSFECHFNITYIAA